MLRVSCQYPLQACLLATEQGIAKLHYGNTALLLIYVCSQIHIQNL